MDAHTATPGRAVLSVGGRVIALTLTLFICFAAASGLAGVSGGTPSADGAAAAPALLAVCLLDSLVLTYVIVRSRWSGWRLMAAVFVAFYGAMTVMSQIESAVFVTRLPPGMLPRLFLMGALIAAPFSILAVFILGKGKAGPDAPGPNRRLVMPAPEWAWKLGLIVIAYVVLYFTFGYFIAWQNAAVREYYGGIDEGSFLRHMGAVLHQSPGLVPLQVLRAMGWVLIALPLIRMMKGEWRETALAVGLVFAVLMNAQLLLPNPYMPAAVRSTHLIETASSNFIFGCLVGWLLARGARRGGSHEMEA